MRAEPKPITSPLAALVAFAVFGATAAAGQGYFISNTRSQVTVNTNAHWSAWDFAPGTVEVSPSGEVSPHFVRKGINATLDITRHLQREAEPGTQVSLLDAVEAGSNRAAIVNLFDGDESTFWEPDLDRPLRDWWFQVDLGRIVSARRIVPKFAQDGLGDPFLHFSVFTSAGETEVGLEGIISKRIFKTIRANKEQRTFEIELEIDDPNPDPEFAGDMIRFVQVVITDTDSTRGRQVSADEFEQLAGGEQGSVDHYKKVAQGEVLVEREVYEAIDPALQGSIIHHRRERPRLSELEVWSLGENVALEIVPRGGFAESSHEGAMGVLLDGDLTSLALSLGYKATFAGTPGDRFVRFDLGASYWLDTSQLFFRSIFFNYKIETSDGTLGTGGDVVWTTQASRDVIDPTQRRGIITDIGTTVHVNSFDLTPVRFFRIIYPYTPGADTRAVIREAQLFGEGFQPLVELTSGLIRLGQERNLVSVSWDADTPAGTAVEIQTRTGNEVSDAYRYHNKAGEEVSAAAYDKLGFFQKGHIDTVEIAGADWSNWSAPYRDPGDPVTSPSPRQFMMLRARLLTEDPLQAPRLRSVSVAFTRPLARALVGELEPGFLPEFGTDGELSLFVRPVLSRGSPGFDEILLRVLADMSLVYRSLRLGREADWTAGDSADVEAPAVEVLPTGPDSLWLRLDRVVSSAVELVEVRFATALFRPGALLLAQIGNSTVESSWQRVDPGNATTLASSEGMQLLGPTGRRPVLGNLQIEPPLFTPNGDGVNDNATIAFTVQGVTGNEPVRVDVHDLSGRRVWSWRSQRPVTTGRYDIIWAGRTDTGARVPPGSYLVYIGMPADSESASATVAQRMIAVAY